MKKSVKRHVVNPQHRRHVRKHVVYAVKTMIHLCFQREKVNMVVHGKTLLTSVMSPNRVEQFVMHVPSLATSVLNTSSLNLLHRPRYLPKHQLKTQVVLLQLALLCYRLLYHHYLQHHHSVRIPKENSFTMEELLEDVVRLIHSVLFAVKTFTRLSVQRNVIPVVKSSLHHLQRPFLQKCHPHQLLQLLHLHRLLLLCQARCQL